MIPSVSRKYFLLKKVLPFCDLFTRQEVMSFYRFFQESQWWPLDKLLSCQQERMQETLKIAYAEVPFYRERFDKFGVRPEQISSQSDLVRIPATSKDDLRASYPNLCVRNSPNRPVRELFTSGSSGRPFAVRVDSSTMSETRALMLLRASFSGWDFGSPILQTGMSLDRGIIKRVKDFMLGVQYVSAFNLSDKVLDQYLSLIEKNRLEFIMGYPGSIYFLAKRALQLGFNRRLKGIVCWGDNLYRHYRAEMENAFGCRITDTYGCGEGIQVAAQCGEDSGVYHVFMPHVIVEVVDENGFPVPPGTLGNILLTRLDAGAMPLIRYRVGDMGRMGERTTCPCGRGLEKMISIDGRDSDTIITPQGNRLIVHFFTGIFEYFTSVDTFKVIQNKPGEIRVQILPGCDFKSEHLDKIKKEILAKGDPDLAIEMEVVREIMPEKSNKRRFVVSTISNQS